MEESLVFLDTPEYAQARKRILEAKRTRPGWTTVVISSVDDVMPAVWGNQHVVLGLDHAYAVESSAEAELLRRLDLYMPQQVMEPIAFTVEGVYSLAVVGFLLSRMPNVRMVDLGTAYPCSPKLVQTVTETLPQLHELHLNFLNHSQFTPSAVIDVLSDDSQSTIEHLELYELQRVHLSQQKIVELYSLPNLQLLALRHFTDPCFNQAPSGFGLALTWDPREQEYSLRRSKTVDSTGKLINMFMRRTKPRCHPPPCVKLGLGGTELAALDKGNRENVETRWGYVNHARARAQALHAAVQSRTQ